MKTTPFEPAAYLDTIESQRELLDDAVESGDPKYLAIALGTIAKARGMSGVAGDVGVTRQALYKALSKDGDPRLSTFMGVTKALGLKLVLRNAAA